MSVNATKVGVLKVGLATKGLAKGAKSLAKAAPKRIKVKASEAKGATYSTALNTADAATQVAAAAKAVFNLGLDAAAQVASTNDDQRPVLHALEPPEHQS